MSVAPITDREQCSTYGYIVAAMALTAALLMVFVFPLQGFIANPGDPYGFGAIARGLADHGLVKLTRRGTGLYPEFIAVIYRLGGSNMIVIIIQCVMHIATSLLAFSLGRRLFNARTGLLSGLFCAFHPMFLRYVPDLHMETFLVFMCTLTIWTTVRFYDYPNVANGILVGVVGMSAVLAKGVMLPYLGVFTLIGAVVALRRRSAKQLMAVVAIPVAMAIVVAPWTYRNYQVTGGKFVLLAPGASDAFLRGYIFTRWEFATLQKPPFNFAEVESMEWLIKIAHDAGTEWELDELVDEENNSRVVKHMIVTEPLDTARKIFVGLFTFWYQMTSLRNSLIPGSLAVVSWVLAFVGLRRAHREGRPSWLLWLPIIVMNVFVAILIPLGRYSVPILPLLMILAAFGVDTLWDRRKVTASGKD